MSLQNFPNHVFMSVGRHITGFRLGATYQKTTNMDGDPSLPARTAGFRFFQRGTTPNVVFATALQFHGLLVVAVASDAFNLKKWLMERFPISLSMIPIEARKPLAKLGESLRRELKRRTTFTKTTRVASGIS